MSKKSEYDMKYAKEFIVRKFIPFNKAKAEDAEMLEYLSEKDNVTQYIKDLIRADMKK